MSKFFPSTLRLIKAFPLGYFTFVSPLSGLATKWIASVMNRVLTTKVISSNFIDSGLFLLTQGTPVGCTLHVSGEKLF